MSYASTGAGSSVLWVAMEAGFFRGNGIDPDMAYIESAASEPGHFGIDGLPRRG